MIDNFFFFFPYINGLSKIAIDKSVMYLCVCVAGRAECFFF